MIKVSQLDKYRRIVDDIDSQVVSLMERRMEISTRIGEFKKSNDLPIYNPEREKLIMEKNSDYLRDKKFTPQIQELYALILRQSFDIQQEISENENGENNN